MTLLQRAGRHLRSLALGVVLSASACTGAVYDNPLDPEGSLSVFLLNTLAATANASLTRLGSSWEVVATGQFPRRRYAQLLVFKGRLYVIGGDGVSSTNLTDMWSSADGTTWISEATLPIGGGRAVATGSHIHLMSSSATRYTLIGTGAAWVNVGTAGFPVNASMFIRASQMMAVASGTGYSSGDTGATWSNAGDTGLAIQNTVPPAHCFVVFGTKTIALVGGGTATNAGTVATVSEMQTLTSWTERGSVLIPGFAGFGCGVFNQSIFVVASNVSKSLLAARSTDGVTFSSVPVSAGVTGQILSNLVVFKNRMYFLGGQGSGFSSITHGNDVFASLGGGTGTDSNGNSDGSL